MSIEDELRNRGIDPGSWQEIKMKPPKRLTEIQSLLEKLRDTLQQQVVEDTDMVSRLRELQNRSKFGGGE